MSPETKAIQNKTWTVFYWRNSQYASDFLHSLKSRCLSTTDMVRKWYHFVTRNPECFSFFFILIWDKKIALLKRKTSMAATTKLGFSLWHHKFWQILFWEQWNIDTVQAAETLGTFLFPKEIWSQTPASTDSSKRTWYLWHQVTPIPAGELVEQPVGEPGRPAAHQVNSWEIRCPGKIGSLLIRQLAVRGAAQEAE